MKRILLALTSIILLTGCNNKIEIIYTEMASIDYSLTTIYEGENYRYVVRKTDDVYIKRNLKKLSYKEALDQNLITIADLYEAGAKIFKENKYQANQDTKILYRIDNRGMVLNAINVFYEDEEYQYSFSSTFVEQIAYVEYKDELLSYKEALNRKLVTIEEIYKACPHIIKEKRVEIRI